MKKLKKGKFFVFEGIDGSGKATQTKLLASFLQKQGYKVQKIDFPQHGERSSAMVDDYLNGKYGDQVDPFVGSIFYAIDRYDASFKIREWLDKGYVVLADRYLVSNIGHQGGKLIKNKKAWQKYVDWLYGLEYQLFKIPKPDFTIILKTSAEFSHKMSSNISDAKKQARRKSYLGSSKKKDIHEKDKSHLANALNSYVAIAKRYPKDFKVIECLKKGELLPIEAINQKIVGLISKSL